MRVLPLLLVFLLGSVALSAASRQIGLVEQSPGSLTTILLVQTDTRTALVVHTYGKGVAPNERVRDIPKEEFESLWATFSGPPAAAFVIKPKRSDPIGDFTTYAVRLIAGGRDVLTLTIPKGQAIDGVSEAIAKIHAWAGAQR